MVIWSTFIHLTGESKKHLGLDICSSLNKNLQSHFVKRFVGNSDAIVYDSYNIIKSTNESYLVICTPDDELTIIQEKYLKNLCNAFDKKFLYLKELYINSNDVVDKILNLFP